MKPDTPEAATAPVVPPSARTRVISCYSGYTPPFDVAKLVEKMVASVPPKYLTGLREVVLTNFDALPRKARRGTAKSRKRKFNVSRARGRYHPAWNNQPAWIEIFVENTLRNWERGWWLRFRFLREGHIGDVLFHEIGHHIHFAVRTEYREREDVADVWKARLDRNYSRQSRSLLRVTLRILGFLLGPLLKPLIRRSAEIELAKGMISRAEFEERKNKTPLR